MDIPRSHVPGGHIKISEAQDLPLVLHPMVLEEALTDEHESTGFVLAVKGDAREMIEEGVKMAARMQLAQPCRPFGGQSNGG